MPLSDVIRSEIQSGKALSFARFMELALYHPEFGYYEAQRSRVGRGGDFHTSVSVGSLFGRLLSGQFALWGQELSTSQFYIVEAGAHDGVLARDVLHSLRETHPELFQTVVYVLVEPSVVRRQWQETTLADFAGRVRWVQSFAELAPEKPRGVIYSNELLDAMPVHRLVWNAGGKQWEEWGVGLDSTRWVWQRRPLDPQLLDTARREFWPPGLEALEAVLPDGFTTEIAPAATHWWRQAANLLDRGWIIAVDYGLAADEFFTPGRHQGTLRGYRDHRVVTDVLALPGEQDLTAHVNFTALQRVGETAGLETEVIESQGRYLTALAGKLCAVHPKFAEALRDHARQFQTLVHPQHFGASFRVLVQRRSQPTGPSQLGRA